MVWEGVSQGDSEGGYERLVLPALVRPASDPSLREASPMAEGGANPDEIPLPMPAGGPPSPLGSDGSPGGEGAVGEFRQGDSQGSGGVLGSVIATLGDPLGAVVAGAAVVDADVDIEPVRDCCCGDDVGFIGGGTEGAGPDGRRGKRNADERVGGGGLVPGVEEGAGDWRRDPKGHHPGN